jgi:hypothetical protein
LLVGRGLHLALWLSLAAGLAAQESPAVRVFILAGQSNMQGQGVVDHDHPEHYNGGKGTLNRVSAKSGSTWRYSQARDSKGGWRTRDDVFVRYRTGDAVKAGGLSIGFTGYGGRHHIGPEFQCGHVLGDALEAPVLLIKTAWGGKSLQVDFRPPSAGGVTGPYYKKMLAEIAEGLREAPREIPALAGRAMKIEGLVWFQGWNDMVNKDARSEYADNLEHLIKDLRKDLKLPGLPVVVGEMGNEGRTAGQSILDIRRAEQVACARFGRDGGVSFVPTAQYARPKNQSPNTGHGHHYYGNAESYFRIGGAFGHALLEAVGHRYRVVRDIPYSKGTDLHERERCKLDVYTPSTGKKRPVLVWFHGGGMVQGDKGRGLAPLVGRLFAEQGYVVVMANYRLSPRAKYPSYVEDAAGATAWAFRNADRYGGDPSRVFVGGHSAGAYLALLVGMDPGYLKKHQLDAASLAGLLPVSGQTDSHWAVRDERKISRKISILDEAAPLTHVAAEVPAMILIVAQRDLPGRVALNERLYSELQGIKHPATSFYKVAGRSHSSLISQLPSPSDRTMKLLLSFLRERSNR